MIGPQHKFKLYLRSIGRQLVETEKAMVTRFLKYSSNCGYRIQLDGAKIRCKHPKTVRGDLMVRCKMHTCHYVQDGKVNK